MFQTLQKKEGAYCLLLLLGFLASATALGVITPIEKMKHLERLQNGQWTPEPRMSDAEKLKLIRQISPIASKDVREDVCYTPQCLDASLMLLQAINFSVNPCDDFYQFSCGRWLAENPIPVTSSRWSHFDLLIDHVNNVTQEILLSPKDDADFKPVNQVKDFNAMCNDLAALETAGLQVLLSSTDKFGGWPSVTPAWDSTQFDVVTATADIRRVFLDGIIVRVVVSQDLKDTARSVIYLDQADFFLPRHILLDQVTYVELIDATVAYYVDVAKELAALTGSTATDAELEADARAMVAFEAELAKISAIDEDRGNTTRIYNPRKLDAYETENAFGWRSHLDTLFTSSGQTIATDEDIIVLELDYMTNLLPLLDATAAKTVSNYVYWRLLSGLLSETNQRMRDIKFEFDKIRSGLTEQLPRQVSCADTSQNIFGMAIGVKYIEQAFDVTSKANVNLMVNNLRTAFKELLTQADWLGDETRAKAAEKADAMRQFMAFPDWLNNQTRLEQEYEGAELVDGKFLETIIGLSLWTGDQRLKTLRAVTDKDYWLTYPGVVNAFYSPDFNSITFPAGILAPPFYRSKGPEAINYGGIGVVIGHEITHGFDDQGSQYDADGNAENWWSEQDLASFLTKAQCIVDQYGEFTVPGIDGTPLHVNGDLTSGENIADNGGVHQSFLAYQNWVQNENGGVPEKRLPGLENITPDQLFFLGYANIWCENITPAALINLVNTNPHSPAEFRVLGPMKNSQTFADHWQCAPGSAMNPAGKCVLW